MASSAILNSIPPPSEVMVCPLKMASTLRPFTPLKRIGLDVQFVMADSSLDFSVSN
jgi:hypothetical protein